MPDCISLNNKLSVWAESGLESTGQRFLEAYKDNVDEERAVNPLYPENVAGWCWGMKEMDWTQIWRNSRAFKDLIREKKTSERNFYESLRTSGLRTTLKPKSCPQACLPSLSAPQWKQTSALGPNIREVLCSFNLSSHHSSDSWSDTLEPQKINPLNFKIYSQYHVFSALSGNINNDIYDFFSLDNICCISKRYKDTCGGEGCLFSMGLVISKCLWAANGNKRET